MRVFWNIQSCVTVHARNKLGGPFTVLSPRYMPTPAAVLAGVPNWHMPPRSGDHACCLSSLMAWLVFGWRFVSLPLQKHGTPLLHCIAHRRRGIGKEAVKKKVKRVNWPKRLRRLSTRRSKGSSPCRPRGPRPLRATPARRCRRRRPRCALPGREPHERERETCLLPCPRSRPETPGSDAPTVTCQ